MHTLKIKEKTNKSGEPVKYGRTMKINSGNLIGVSTKSLHVRNGFLNNTLFLSQKGSGGDICKLFQDEEVIVTEGVFDRIMTYAEKAKAIIK